MLYAGLSHLFTPGWSALGYISHSANFTTFFSWLASPSILPVVNFMNIWGLTLLGLSLLTGLFVKYSAPLGALLMILYYLVLPFPFPNTNSFLIDEHIVYAAALLVLAAMNTGKTWGLDARMGRATN